MNITAKAEAERGEESVPHHDEHSACDADQVEAGDAEKHETHVGYAGIADEQIEVALTHGDPAGMKDISKAKNPENREPMLRAVGHDRKRDSDETIQAELLEDACMKHGRRRWSSAVSQRGPGMKGPQRDQDAKAKHQQWKNPALS